MVVEYEGLLGAWVVVTLFWFMALAIVSMDPALRVVVDVFSWAVLCGNLVRLAWRKARG